MTKFTPRGQWMLRPVAMAALMGCVALPAMADELFYVSGGVGKEAEVFKQVVAPWEEKTGHKVTVVPMPNSSSDQFAQYRLWLAAGTTDVDLYQTDVIWAPQLSEYFVDLSGPAKDLIGQHFPSVIESQTSDGKLVALPLFTDAPALYYRTDLLEKYGQEVTAKLKEDFDENPYTATTINGTIYAVPANKGMALNGNLIWDDDIAQAAGVDMSTVNSIEDLEAVFEQVHAYDPNIVCYAPNNQGDTSLIRPILRSEEKIDCLNDTDYYAGVSMNGDSTVTNLYASDAFMEKCKLMREWNQKGYLQADAATTTSTAPELFSAGRCFSTIDAYGGDSAGAVLSLSSGHNLKSKILYNFYFDSASVYVDFGIASTSKVPEAAMKMINRLWTDEYLINTFLYGEEGVDYVKPDADHWAYPDGKDATTVGYTAALCTGVIGSESLQYQPVGTDIADIQLKLKHNKESERSPFFGFMFDASGVTTEMSAIANVYNQYVPGLICGTVDPETTMPEFLNALDAAGINTVIQAKQEQLDAWIAAQK